MGNNPRYYSFIDNLITELDTGLRAMVGTPTGTGRMNPANNIRRQSQSLDKSQQKVIAGLMRINHTGEVCAQALYQGQSLTARNKNLQNTLKQAAQEENDHLLWCHQRLQQLDSHRSFLNPIWYVGSLTMGMTAGMIGDKWNLGFLAETERQVVEHLNEHIARLPDTDPQSKAILQQMAIDEEHHAHTAIGAGAAELPTPIKKLMTLTSKIMKKIAFVI